MTLLRTRLGNWRLGIRIERLPQTLVVRTLFSHVADTIGILNKFSNTDKMCLFLDFDDKCNIEKIITQVIPELISD